MLFIGAMVVHCRTFCLWFVYCHQENLTFLSRQHNETQLATGAQEYMNFEQAMSDILERKLLVVHDFHRQIMDDLLELYQGESSSMEKFSAVNLLLSVDYWIEIFSKEYAEEDKHLGFCRTLLYSLIKAICLRNVGAVFESFGSHSVKVGSSVPDTILIEVLS